MPFTLSGAGQNLALWLFAPSTDKNLQCKISLRAKRRAGSLDSHSFKHHHYVINSGDYPTSQVLKQKDNQLHGPIPLSITLNKDLKKQSALANLSCDQPGVLASAGIISAGLSDAYDFREQLDAP